MNIKYDGQKIRVDYEGLDQYDYEDFNLTKIELFKNDRFIDVTDFIELFDIDLIESLVKEGIEIINTLHEP